MIVNKIAKRVVHKVAGELARKYKSEPIAAVKDLVFAIEWLNRYGYLEGLPTVQGVVNAVKKFQKTYGITIDGLVGQRSLRAMSAKRCGCPDFYPKGLRKRSQKMRGGGVSPWGKRNLAVYVREFIPGFDRQHQIDAMERAFSELASIANVHITRISNPRDADIIIGVGRGRGDQFDGPSGTLAYTYLRRQWDLQRQGPIPLLFDADENWSTEPVGAGIWYFIVLLHELLHVAGDMEHSRVMSALMAPTYNPRLSGLVEPDDKSRLIRQFGPAVTPVEPNLPSEDDGEDDVISANAKVTILIPKQTIEVKLAALQTS